MHTIAMIISSLSGGTGYVLEQIALSQSKRNKVIIVPLSFNIDQSISQNIKSKKNIKILKNVSSPKANFKNILLFIKTLKKINCNILISFDNRSNFYSYIFKNISDVKWFSSIHGLEGAFNLKWKFINRFILKSSFFCIVPSIAVKNKAIEKKFLIKSKIKVIPNGIKILNKLPKRNLKNKLSFCLIGNFYSLSIKGHDIAIRSLNYLPKDFSLIIIGSGKYLNHFKKFSQKENLTDRVKFAGFKNKIEIYKVLKNTSCLVVPSQTEAFGLSVVEAMSRGVPVIANNVGGISEIIKHNRNGIIINEISPEKLAREVLSLSKNKKLNEKIGFSGFTEVNKRFSLQRMIQDYDITLNSLDSK